MNSVIVIGGGASGMIAALTAAESKDRHVILLERQSRVGRKLLATGNGRCNLTNIHASAADYRGEVPDFASFALKEYSPETILDYFSSLGLVCSRQYGGRVFPLSDNAGSVVDVLRYALEYSGVELRTDCCVRSAGKSGRTFTVTTENNEIFRGDSLIIACGGCAGGKLGGTGDGYALLKSFGHLCTKLYPALVPVTTDSEYPRSLKGIRVEAKVSLSGGGTPLCESCGELQFTEKGISGPAAFDISRDASVSGGEISVDFLYDIPEKELLSMLRIRKNKFPDMEIQNIFFGILHNRIGTVLAKYCSLRPSDKCSDLSGRDLASLAAAAKQFRMNVKGTGSFDAAQITVGGIKTSEFSPETMESRLVSGLFACGEVLDIDAPCGGYNLQWAWASGRLAGRLGK